MDYLTIPDFLKLTADQRRAAWRKAPSSAPIAPDAEHIAHRAKILERREQRQLKAEVAALEGKIELLKDRSFASDAKARALVKQLEAKLAKRRSELWVSL